MARTAFDVVVGVVALSASITLVLEGRRQRRPALVRLAVVTAALALALVGVVHQSLLVIGLAAAMGLAGVRYVPDAATGGTRTDRRGDTHALPPRLARPVDSALAAIADLRVALDGLPDGALREELAAVARALDETVTEMGRDARRLGSRWPSSTRPEAGPAASGVVVNLLDRRAAAVRQAAAEAGALALDRRDDRTGEPLARVRALRAALDELTASPQERLEESHGA